MQSGETTKNAVLFVAGGSSFLGTEICRNAASLGYRVISLSRRGRPTIRESWVDQVEWLKGDLCDPASWRSHLAGCTAAIHSVVTIKERPEAGITFQRVNYESALTLLREAQAAGVQKFVFLTAKSKPPWVSDEFLTMKRKAEQAVIDSGMCYAILRPFLLYGRRRPVTLLFKLIADVLAWMPRTGGEMRADRPLPVESVGAAAVRAAVSAEVAGILDTNLIREQAKNLQTGAQVTQDRL